jgi:hypothetical protein
VQPCAVLSDSLSLEHEAEHVPDDINAFDTAAKGLMGCHMTHRMQVYWLSQLLLVGKPGTKTSVRQSSGADQQRSILIQTQPWGLF